MVIWLIGLSGSGKTTIGNELYKLIKAKQRNTVFLDGDAFREAMGNDLGHTIEDRRKNADRICRFCKLLDSQNINVVCCILSLFHESQNWNRENYQRYFEVYIKVSPETLFRRNQKDIYRKSVNGEMNNVAGVDIEFKPPIKPDLVINNDKETSNFDILARGILKAIPEFEL